MFVGAWGKREEEGKERKRRKERREEKREIEWVDSASELTQELFARYHVPMLVSSSPSLSLISTVEVICRPFRGSGIGNENVVTSIRKLLPAILEQPSIPKIHSERVAYSAREHQSII